MSGFARELPDPTTVRALRSLVGVCEVIGEANRIVRGIGSLSSTQPGVLAFCDAIDAQERLAATAASVVIVQRGAAAVPASDQTLIAVEDVRAAFIDLVQRLLPDSDRPADPPPGIDGTARVDPTASVARSACIGGNVLIGPRTRIAPGAVIYADCVIGGDCVIGANAVIGWVGLAYHDRHDGRRSFFPHLAGVPIVTVSTSALHRASAVGCFRTP
jgi:UDP-3-O-[3-hydroxymyristoyl] glucosamine N-acyltransferase